MSDHEQEQREPKQYETAYSEAPTDGESLDPTQLGTEQDHPEQFETAYSDPEEKSS
ncbi:hypothetical protein [Enemella dayhoffiae]|uniref:hypothetical protein n=1 Tax=Enemella dayhoffiae TaxID=2016507 RepID=UPI001595E3BF|nr:hypothetical protein [Enemella dayhoffiae]